MRLDQVWNQVVPVIRRQEGEPTGEHVGAGVGDLEPILQAGETLQGSLEVGLRLGRAPLEQVLVAEVVDQGCGVRSIVLPLRAAQHRADDVARLRILTAPFVPPVEKNLGARRDGVLLVTLRPRDDRSQGRTAVTGALGENRSRALRDQIRQGQEEFLAGRQRHGLFRIEQAHDATDRLPGLPGGEIRDDRFGLGTSLGESAGVRWAGPPLGVEHRLDRLVVEEDLPVASGRFRHAHSPNLLHSCGIRSAKHCSGSPMIFATFGG